MALKINLKPYERLIIGGAEISIIRNGENSNDIILENKVPILIRGKDIMLEKDATSPCKRIYFIIQLMYLDNKNSSRYHHIYWKFVRDVLDAAPSTLGFLDAISEHIISERYYHALKITRQLIDYEQELIQLAKSKKNSADNQLIVSPA